MSKHTTPPVGTRRGARARWRGAVSKNLLVFLGVVAVVAALFWVYRWRSAAQEVPPPAPATEYMLSCSACQGTMMVSAADRKKLPEQDGKVQCPQCKQFTAYWGLPTQGVGGVAVP